MGSEEGALRPEAAPRDEPSRGFVRGKKAPRGVVWFGFRSFWGHLQHFIASAIATEDIDSRHWMHADRPERLASEIAAHLEPSRAKKSEHGAVPRVEGASTLTEAIDRDLWIDWVADTGDDVSVSEAVARLVFAPYRLPEVEGEGEILAPRGDILFFGGDTAYPVATTSEIHDRVIVPFNRVLADVRDPGPAKRRVLLGIPGNHDWYDGLDGFGRMFRRRAGELTLSLAEEQPHLEPERESRFEHVVEFVEKFVVGGQVHKQRALVLDGYVPFQHASYFALPLAPGIDLFAVDRQLRGVDFRQQTYFEKWRSAHPDRTLFVALPDPVYSFLEPSPTGSEMIEALSIDLARERCLVLAGDVHHYQRREVGASLHVIAGGGGAFLHPARLGAPSSAQPLAQWPGVEATRSLLWLVPWHVAGGRSGFIPHVVLFLFFAPALGVGVWFGGSATSLTTASIAAGVVGAIVLALIGGIRRAPRAKASKVLVLASIAGAAMGLLPAAVSTAFAQALLHFGLQVGPRLAASLMLVLAVFIGAFAFGAYLAMLTALGLESTQAFTCLGNPGFKHFVRLRVRKDGSAIDAWCVGLVDPLREASKPVLVDRFTFRRRR